MTQHDLIFGLCTCYVWPLEASLGDLHLGRCGRCGKVPKVDWNVTAGEALALFQSIHGGLPTPIDGGVPWWKLPAYDLGDIDA